MADIIGEKSGGLAKLISLTKQNKQTKQTVALLEDLHDTEVHELKASDKNCT